MKKVILLLVAVMIASVSFAKQDGNKYGDASVTQLGSFNKSFVDQTQASGGGWYYAEGSGTDATVYVNGNSNNTAITQVGNYNVAGKDIRINWADACSGFFCASNVGDPFEGDLTITTCDIELACCQSIDGASYTIDFAPIDAGIYVVGDNNKASISQYGDYMLAGIKINGNDNTASIFQAFGDHNAAFINVLHGTDNKGLISQWGSDNMAQIELKGHGNTASVHQYGMDNKAAQKVHGHGNLAIATQVLYGNEAIQDVHGHNNNVLLYQFGCGNQSVQKTSGMDHNSVVTQMGVMNQSVVLQ